MMTERLNGEIFERSKQKGIILNVCIVLLSLLLISFSIFNLTVSVCSVNGVSMMNTLFDNETILMERYIRDLKRGDIVTISDMSKELIIKRVIGLEGDRLVFKQNMENPKRVDLYLSIDGGEYVLQDEKYIRAQMTTAGWGVGDEIKYFYNDYKLALMDVETDDFGNYAITVNNGECFVMGDNRNDSSDSRYYGIGKIKNISGRMFYAVHKNSLLEKILLFIYREK